MPGYHARTPLRCYIFSVILIVVVLLGLKYILYNDVSLLIIVVISGAIIFILAPISDENKPLDKLETKVFKKCTRIILFVEIGLISLFWILGLNWIAICIAVSMVVVGVMVFIGCIRKAILRSKNQR